MPPMTRAQQVRLVLLMLFVVGVSTWVCSGWPPVSP